MLRGEVKRQLCALCAHMDIMNKKHLNCIPLGLGAYFFPFNAFSNQKRMMCHVAIA